MAAFDDRFDLVLDVMTPNVNLNGEGVYREMQPPFAAYYLSATYKSGSKSSSIVVDGNPKDAGAN